MVGLGGTNPPGLLECQKVRSRAAESHVCLNVGVYKIE